VAVEDLFEEQADYNGETVVVTGEIVKLCPAGCWFDLDDGTEIIRVILDADDFVLPQSAFESTVVVEGVFDYDDSEDVFSIFGSGVSILN